MGRISEIKKQLRHKDWEAMVSECQTSGKKVEEWCAENGIKVSTYYKRLYVLRTELIEGNEKQSIVPVSISAELTDANSIVTENASGSGKGKIMIRKDGLEIELPENISEKTILALLRGLKQC